MFFLRRWGHRQLLGSWVAYWIGLLAVIAAPAVAQWWKLQRTGGHGTISVEVSAGLLEMGLWIAGPPILLALLWLAVRPRRGERRAGTMRVESPPRELSDRAGADEAALWERQQRERDAERRDEPR